MAWALHLRGAEGSGGPWILKQVQHDEERKASPLEFPLRRGRKLRQRRTFAQGPVEQVATAIGTTFIELVGATRAKGALERADEGAMDVGGQIASAAFAIGSHFKHSQNFLQNPFVLNLSKHRIFFRRGKKNGASTSSGRTAG
jgi:hypothetical protein